LKEEYFSLIVPTYNEYDNIEELISIVGNILNLNNIKYEILICDDNSPDKTWEKVSDISKKDPRVKLIRRFRNKGLTPAVLEGMERSEGSILGVMDADLQHDVSILPRMIELTKQYDLIIASRYLENTVNLLSPFRKFLSKMGIHLSNIILGLKTTDPLSGYFVLRKSIFLELSHLINAKGFKILLQILGRKRNILITEVPYSFGKRTKGETKLTGEVAIDFLAELISLRLHRYISSRFIRYSIIGLSGILINLMGQLVCNTILDIRENSFKNNEYSNPGISVIIGFILSVLSNFYWNNLWTFKEKRIEGIFKNIQGFFRYLFITLIGFLIQISVWRFSLEALINTFSYYSYFLYLANIIGIFCATTWNYYISKNFMWKIES